MLRRLSSIDEVRKEYERVRKPFVTRIQDAALWGGKAAGWRSAPARWLRNSLFSVATHITPMRKASLELTAGINPAEKQWL
jgi:2-polyprenyl-6-methoxyphenol hydroxylase-like FAD-dependent oxidoreductase